MENPNEIGSCWSGRRGSNSQVFSWGVLTALLLAELTKLQPKNQCGAEVSRVADKTASSNTSMMCKRASSTLKKKEALRLMNAPRTITAYITFGNPVPTASSRSRRDWISRL